MKFMDLFNPENALNKCIKVIMQPYGLMGIQVHSFQLSFLFTFVCLFLYFIIFKFCSFQPLFIKFPKWALFTLRSLLKNLLIKAVFLDHPIKSSTLHHAYPHLNIISIHYLFFLMQLSLLLIIYVHFLSPSVVISTSAPLFYPPMQLVI